MILIPVYEAASPGQILSSGMENLAKPRTTTTEPCTGSLDQEIELPLGMDILME